MTEIIVRTGELSEARTTEKWAGRNSWTRSRTMNHEREFDGQAIRAVIECGLIGICLGGPALLLHIAVGVDDAVPALRLTRLGFICLAVYGSLTGGGLDATVAVLTSMNSYDKRFPWLLRLVVAVVSALGGAMNIPFTLPQDFFE